MRQHVNLIAEVSSNAGGSVLRAVQFIDAFAVAGADIVKFQLTRVAHLSRFDPQYEWFQHAEWGHDQIAPLVAACEARSVVPMFTVNHPDDVWEVKHLPYVKVGCGEAHSGKLAEAVLARPFQRVFVSEGIRPAHARYLADPRVTILGVCPYYPAPRGVVGLRWACGRYQGWSDHSIGLEESQLAVILGATVIERHVQIPIQARPPQPYELTVEEFAELRQRIDQDPERFLGRWGHVQVVT